MRAILAVPETESTADVKADVRRRSSIAKWESKAHGLHLAAKRSRVQFAVSKEKDPDYQAFFFVW
jgi:hypothetical protein